MEALFTGTMVVVKSGIDQESANRYQDAMKKAGAVCAIREKSADAVKPQAQQQPTPISATEVKPVQPPSVVEVPTTPASSSEDDGMLAPPGVQLIEHEDILPEPDIDISAIHMAEVGAELADPVAPPPPLDLKIDNLDMAEVGADIADPVAPPPPPDVNIDNLDMAEVGTDVTDPVAPPPPLDVNIDNINTIKAGADMAVFPTPVPDLDVDTDKLKFVKEIRKR